MGYPDGPGFYRRMGDMAGMGTDYFWLAATRPGGTDSGPPQICTTMEAPKALKEMEACDNAPGESNIYEITRLATANYHRVIPAHAYGD